MADRAFIRLEGVTKRFGSVTAVAEVDLEVAEGEFFSLLGPSGCGKTTLLRMLAGFESPTEGEIWIDGAPMAGVPPHQRPTNMVFQSYAIFPHLDVRANIAYGLRKERLARAEVTRRVEEMLEMVKLPGFGPRRSNELSGGQRQRVALARALVRRPKVLLLDEPLGALDKKLREEMQIELRALQQSVGVTFVFVTHDQEEALTLSDRVAVMSSGRVLQVASPKALYNRPTSVTVADFIGQMNFFDATVAGLDGDRAVLDVAGLGRVQAPGDHELAAPGSEVVVAVRPERFSLARERPEGAGGAVEGRMLTTAYLGDRSHYYVALAGRERPVAVAAQEVDAASRDWLERDRTVWLSWADEALIVLPRE